VISFGGFIVSPVGKLGRGNCEYSSPKRVGQTDGSYEEDHCVFCRAWCASERVEVCAEYSGTGQTYHVAAISTTGSELNEATDTLNYNFLSQYIVIIWEKDQTSVIEMDGSFVGPTYVRSGGKDQEGRSWEISPTNFMYVQRYASTATLETSLTGVAS
jgi:hypothetical protein